MRFAIFMLIVLGLLSIIGSLIPQNMPAEVYIERYGDRADLILSLGLDQVYTTWWFALATAFLCLSLLFCVVVKIKPIIQLHKKGGFRASSRKIGSWILHVGMLVTILFFALGNATAYQESIYNVPGSISQVPNRDMTIEIEEFEITLREDDTVSEYRTRAKVFQGDELIEEGDILVNHPMIADGYQFSQASFGLAVDCQIYKQKESIGTAVLFEREFVAADNDILAVQMINLFPDVEEREDGLYNASKKLNNPYIQYSIYYAGNLVKQGMVESDSTVSVGNYDIEFTNPRHYTVLDIRKDDFAIFTGLGALLLMGGIVLVFFGPTDKKED